MPKLSDVSNKALREILGTYSAGAVAVPAINAGSAATFKTTQSPAASLSVVINGQPKLLADASAKALATLAALQNPITGQDGYYVQPVSTTVYYLIVVNYALTWYTIQGTYSGQVISRPYGLNGLGDGSMPDIAVAETYAPVGAIKIVTDSTHTFTPATTALDAAGITATYASIFKLGNALPTFA